MNSAPLKQSRIEEKFDFILRYQWWFEEFDFSWDAFGDIYCASFVMTKTQMDRMVRNGDDVFPNFVRLFNDEAPQIDQVSELPRECRYNYFASNATSSMTQMLYETEIYYRFDVQFDRRFMNGMLRINQYRYP